MIIVNIRHEHNTMHLFLNILLVCLHCISRKYKQGIVQSIQSVRIIIIISNTLIRIIY